MGGLSTLSSLADLPPCLLFCILAVGIGSLGIGVLCLLPIFKYLKALSEEDCFALYSEIAGRLY